MDLRCRKRERSRRHASARARANPRRGTVFGLAAVSPPGRRAGGDGKKTCWFQRGLGKGGDWTGTGGDSNGEWGEWLDEREVSLVSGERWWRADGWARSCCGIAFLILAV
jgi:hypothetical protein